MSKGAPSYHLEIQTHRKNPYGLLRNSYREQGKVRHETLCRITGLSKGQLVAMRNALRGEKVGKEDIRITGSREYGASFALHALAKRTGLDKALYSQPGERWVRDCLAMAIGRVVYAGSKLSLSHCGTYSALWDICGVADVEVEKDCYEAMDRLLQRQEAIQKALARKHMRDGMLVLYDITSSYMEGAYADSELVDFGYNRDKKRGHRQIVIALLCNGDGCPVAVEVFPGNTKDETTVGGKIAELRQKYGIERVIFTGDRGMVTMAQYRNIDHDTVRVVSALTHKRIEALCAAEKMQLGMFDERGIVEVVDGNLRYCLCRNPDMAARETDKRRALVEKTREELAKIKAGGRKGKNGKQARAGGVLGKYKVGKFFTVSGQDDDFDFRVDEDRIAAEQALDGCYVVFTDVPAAEMPALSVVESYKRLTRVEQAFRSLKTTRLEIRPVFHKKDERIRAHVFLCMLAYYLMWHMRQALGELIQADGAGGNRRYSFDYVIEALKALREDSLSIAGTEAHVLSKPTQEQRMILDSLGVHW